ncbi:MAG: hypothetical protein WBN28_14595 [Lutimonas sp.]
MNIFKLSSSCTDFRIFTNTVLKVLTIFDSLCFNFFILVNFKKQTFSLFITSLSFWEGYNLIAQKDIQFSNSSIEAFNKIIKHQFLLPKNVSKRKMLEKELNHAIFIYNNIRPQFGLKGNTPEEVYQGNVLNFEQYKTHFKEHKKQRILQHQKSNCKICLPN